MKTSHGGSWLRLAVVCALLTGILHACGGPQFQSSGGHGGSGSSNNAGATGTPPTMSTADSGSADGGTHKCLGPEDCDNSDPCFMNVCQADGTCQKLPICAAGQKCCQGHCGNCCDDSECNDGIGCTVDRCFLGACIATANDAACASSTVEMYCSVTGDCRAREPCTAGASGQCNDNDSCTNDTCVGGLCAHDACAMGTICCPQYGGCTECCEDSQCNDNDPCTVDTCGAGSCTHTPLCGGSDECCASADNLSATCGKCCSQTECDDGVACTQDACTQGQCSNVPQNTACPVGQICGATGCNQPVQCNGPGSCTSMNPCLTGSCVQGHCQFDPCQTGLCCVDGCHECCGNGDCDDQNPCTDDSCGAGGTCLHNAVNCPKCSPDLGCYECDTEADCDDQNPCTVDTCNQQHTCDHAGGGCGAKLCCGGNACHECCSPNDCISAAQAGGGPVPVGVPCASCDNGTCSVVSYCTDLQQCCNGSCILKTDLCAVTH